MSIHTVKDGHFFYERTSKGIATGLGIKHLTEKELCLDWFWKELKLYVGIDHFFQFFCLGRTFIWMGHNQLSWTCPNSEMIHKKNLKGPPAPPQCHVSGRNSRANWGTMMINNPLNKGELQYVLEQKNGIGRCVPSLKLTSSLPPEKCMVGRWCGFLLGKPPIFMGKKRIGS